MNVDNKNVIAFLYFLSLSPAMFSHFLFEVRERACTLLYTYNTHTHTHSRTQNLFYKVEICFGGAGRWLPPNSIPTLYFILFNQFGLFFYFWKFYYQNKMVWNFGEKCVESTRVKRNAHAIRVESSTAKKKGGQRYASVYFVEYSRMVELIFCEHLKATRAREYSRRG